MKQPLVPPLDSLLEGLNPEQRRAVLHPEGPLLIVAGPGSGKTRVITHRIAYRVLSGSVLPGRILGITFTNRAAEEMTSRVQSLLGSDSAPKLGTFHWMGHGILRKHIHRLGYRRDFRLLRPNEARRALLAAIERDTLPHGLHLSAIADAVSACKNGAAPEAVAARYGIEQQALIGLLHRYDNVLRAANAVDLDNLLALSARLLETDSSTREMCRRAHDEILVDEYQDVNPIQRTLLELLLPESRTLIAVGDEDQAIYAWRQADARAVLTFPETFPGAETVKLELTYRSTQRILLASSALVNHNKERLGKALRTTNLRGEKPVCFVANDEVEEASWIAREIDRLVRRDGRPWTDFAVMYRVNAQSRALESALRGAALPYHVHSGRRFYDQPEIVRALAYLRLAASPDDLAALAHLLAAVPGIGPRRLDAVRSALASRRGAAGWTLQDISRNFSLPAPVEERVRDLVSRIDAVYAVREGSLSKVLDAAIAATISDLDTLTNVPYETALENLRELQSAAREFEAGRGTLREFVDRASLFSDAEVETEGVSCMSLHAAKGTEFPVVFIAGLEEGLLPHRRSLDSRAEIEEERRLCYVGMTRARERLYLSYARTRLLAGQASAGHGSRFLHEMGSGNVELLVSPTVSSRPRLQVVAPGQRVMHARWQAGTVESVEGAGRDTLVTIVFDRVGRQRVQLCHAPLSLIPAGAGDVSA